MPNAADVAVRDSLIADQESLLNTYRRLFDVDTHIVPGGCTKTAEPTPASTPEPEPGTANGHDAPASPTPEPAQAPNPEPATEAPAPFPTPEPESEPRRLRLLSVDEIVATAPQLAGWVQSHAPAWGDTELAVGACVDGWPETGPIGGIPDGDPHAVCSVIARLAAWPIDYALGDPACVHAVLVGVYVHWQFDPAYPIPPRADTGWAERCGSLLHPQSDLSYGDACALVLRMVSPDMAADLPSSTFCEPPNPDGIAGIGRCLTLHSLSWVARLMALTARDHGHSVFLEVPADEPGDLLRTC